MEPTTAQKTAANAQRQFEGPFLILGISNAWPLEMERRRDYKGPHFEMASIFPIRAVGPSRGAPQGGYEVDAPWLVRPTVEVPKEPRADVFPPNVEKNGQVSTHREWKVTDEQIKLLVSVMDKPMTLRQLGRKIGMSRATAAYWMKELQRRIGDKVKVERMKTRKHKGPAARHFWIDMDARKEEEF